MNESQSPLARIRELGEALSRCGSAEQADISRSLAGIGETLVVLADREAAMTTRDNASAPDPLPPSVTPSYKTCPKCAVVLPCQAHGILDYIDVPAHRRYIRRGQPRPLCFCENGHRDEDCPLHGDADPLYGQSPSGVTVETILRDAFATLPASPAPVPPVPQVMKEQGDTRVDTMGDGHAAARNEVIRTGQLGIERLAALPNGWHTEGRHVCPPINSAAIAKAKAVQRMLTELWAVPMMDGGVQLECHGHGFDFEVSVDPGGSVYDACAALADVSRAISTPSDQPSEVQAVIADIRGLALHATRESASADFHEIIDLCEQLKALLVTPRPHQDPT